jgi:ubiquinone/menaquinone biosynthesis C-methylase UbiE
MTKKSPVEKFSDKFAKEYVRQNRWRFYWYRWIINRIIKESKLKKDFIVLDIGTGTGILPIKINKKVRKIIGIDASQGMMNEAIKVCNKRKIKNVEFKKGLIEDFDFPRNSFDVVITSLAIDHVKNQYNLAKKVRNWLKPSGRFVIGVAYKPEKKFEKLVEKARKNKPQVSAKFMDSFKSFTKVIEEGDYPKWKQPHEFRIETFEHEKILKKAGFKTKVIPTYAPWMAILVGIKK